MRPIRVLRMLGEGGLGRTVAGSWLDAPDAPFALKLLERASAARRAILRQEFFALRALAHPNLVRAIDYGRFELHDGDAPPSRALGIVLELVDGVALPTGGASFEALRAPLADAIEALGAMHRQGFVHGDVKPANVMLRRDGEGVLLDLSAAMPIGSPPSGERSGTPAFLPPEAGAVAAAAALDVFALGRTLETLAHGGTALPAEIQRWVERALDPNASQRPRGLDALLDALRGPTRRAAPELFVPRLVGRSELLAQVEQAVCRALDGTGPALVCLVGPRGAGSSRLLQELRWLLAERADGYELPEAPDAVAELLGRASGVPVRGRGGMLSALRALQDSGSATLLSADRPDRVSRSWLEALATELADGARGVAVIVACERALRAPHQQIALAPLTLAQSAELFAPSFPRALLERAQQASGGLPRSLVELARRVGSVRPTAATVERILAASQPAEHPAPRLLLPPDPLAASRALRLAGQAERAFPMVCLALRRRAADPIALRIEAAACLLARGHTGRARSILARVRGAAQAPPLCERWLDVQAELALKSGQLREATALATQLQSTDPATAWSLAITHASALVLLDADAAEAALVSARAARFEPAPGRLAYRLRSTEALRLHRRGLVGDAERGYAEAAALVEREGLDDVRATASYNYATAAEQAGKLGVALETYERTARLARLTGATASEVRARFALANLLLELGHSERARTHASAALERAEAAGTPTLRALLLTLLAETAPAAERAHAFALARAALPVDAAESAEALEIALAEARSEPLRRSRAEPLWQRAERIESVDILARAALAWPPEEAPIDAIEALLSRLGPGGSRFRLLDLHEKLHGIYTHHGASLHAAEHATRALYLLEALLVQLPRALREPLELRLQQVRAQSAAPAALPASAQRGWPEEIAQLLDVQRRLSAATQVDELLAVALESAIVLAGAERGFVVLETSGDRLDVRAARNLDATRLSGRELSFSRSVVRDVLRSQTARFAVRATGSDDFLQRQRSVHAQKLRAVVALPFSTERGVRGALYLDNRFVAVAPGDRAKEVLLFLRDQIAAALDRALLVSELGARNLELERKSRELELLLEDQQLELARRRQGASKLRTARVSAGKFPAIVGQSEPMQRALALLERVAGADVTVLVEGESGTGKELFARALHQESPRKAAPFVAINCGALPEALLEAELFGASKGAFTGAVKDTRGLFVAADGGTLFLDEIGEMSLAMQVKLLRVLQEREVRPLGKERPVPVDIRVVAATHRALEEEVRLGRFREDLFFRLAVVRIAVPPLRERGTDVVTLAEVILDREAARLGLPRPALAPSALRALVQHAFPGNVRELENVLTKALVLGGSGDLLESEHLGLPPARWTRARRAPAAVERRALQGALDATGGNVVQAARRLGMPRATFYRKLARHGLAKGGE